MRLNLDDIPDYATAALVLAGAAVTFWPPVTTWSQIAVVVCLLLLALIVVRSNRAVRRKDRQEQDHWRAGQAAWFQRIESQGARTEGYVRAFVLTRTEDEPLEASITGSAQIVLVPAAKMTFTGHAPTVTVTTPAEQGPKSPKDDR